MINKAVLLFIFVLGMFKIFVIPDTPGPMIEGVCRVTLQNDSVFEGIIQLTNRFDDKILIHGFCSKTDSTELIFHPFDLRSNDFSIHFAPDRDYYFYRLKEPVINSKLLNGYSSRIDIHYVITLYQTIPKHQFVYPDSFDIPKKDKIVFDINDIRKLELVSNPSSKWIDLIDPIKSEWEKCGECAIMYWYHELDQTPFIFKYFDDFIK